VTVSGSQVSSGNPALLMGAPGLFLLVVIVFAILTVIFSTIGVIRFTRIGSMGEVFNIIKILITIRKIGWGAYISSLIILIVAMVVIVIVITILGMIPVLMTVIEFVLIAPVMLYEARYLSLVYDTAGAA
jgi:hypothetical protein